MSNKLQRYKMIMPYNNNPNEKIKLRRCDMDYNNDVKIIKILNYIASKNKNEDDEKVVDIIKALDYYLYNQSSKIPMAESTIMLPEYLLNNLKEVVRNDDVLINMVNKLNTSEVL